MRVDSGLSSLGCVVECGRGEQLHACRWALPSPPAPHLLLSSFPKLSRSISSPLSRHLPLPCLLPPIPAEPMTPCRRRNGRLGAEWGGGGGSIPCRAKRSKSCLRREPSFAVGGGPKPRSCPPLPLKQWPLLATDDALPPHLPYALRLGPSITTGWHGLLWQRGRHFPALPSRTVRTEQAGPPRAFAWGPMCGFRRLS